MKQKLVTIYLNSESERYPNSDYHGIVEEHLQEYFDDGWRIVSVTGCAGNKLQVVIGWFAVVLEKRIDLDESRPEAGQVGR